MGKRLYLKDPKLFSTSKMHTAYTGSGEKTDAGVCEGLAKQEFVNGIARDVDGQHAQRFIDAGIATETRPKVRTREDDD